MPFSQQHLDGLWWDIRSLPELQFVPDLPQQIQDSVPEFPVLQLDAMVFGRHSDIGEPGENVHNRKIVKIKQVKNETSVVTLTFPWPTANVPERKYYPYADFTLCRSNMSDSISTLAKCKNLNLKFNLQRLDVRLGYGYKRWSNCQGFVEWG